MPFARPVSITGPGDISHQDSAPIGPTAVSALLMPNISRWRAFSEVLAVTAATFGSGLGLTVILHLLLSDGDPKVINLVATLGVGMTALAVAWTFIRESGQSLRSIGWTRRALGLNVLIGLGAFLVTRILLFATGLILVILMPEFAQRGHEENLEALKTALPDMSVPEAVAFMGFVVWWEEIVFRGFLLTRLQVLLKRWWLTIPVGSLLFGVGHLWQGPLALVMVPLLGLALGTLFAWRKSMIPGMVLHLVNNLTALWMVKLLS